MENIKTVNREYLVRKMDSSMLQDLETLHAAVYGRPAEKDHFLHKLDTAYTGIQYIGYMAYNIDNIPVAYYGVIPCFLEYKRRIILAAQSADTMTDPNFRYRGMFVELSRLTFELCRARDIQLLFGFPNENSYHGAVTKLGWQTAGVMDRFTIPVKSPPLLTLSAKFPWLAPLYKKYCRRILQNYILPIPGLSNKVHGEGFGGIYRDEAYLEYKTYSATAVIRAGHCNAWIRIREGLFLGDLQATDKTVSPKDLTKAISVLKRAARLLGLPYISFISSRGTRLHGLFSAVCTPVPSFPVLVQDFGSGIPWEDLKFTFADIDIF